MVKPGILVIADDASLRATLAKWLLRAGYAVELAESPRRARDVISKTGIGVAILAPQGLGAEGVELARELAGEIGHIIVIDNRTADSGAPAEPPIEADARVSLPLDEPDVLAKVSSVLNSAPMREVRPAPQRLRFEGYTLDAGARICVDASGQEMTLTRAEFSLLLAFAQQPGRVLSRDELTRVVAGRGAEPDDRSIDVLISRLRRKIEPEPKAPRLIVTVPGEGYRFTARPQVAATDGPGEVPGERAPQKTEAQFKKQDQAKDVPGLQADRPRSTRALLALAAGLAAVLVIAAVGWQPWSRPPALQRLAEATPPAASSEVRAPSTPPPPVTSEADRRAAVFKRMVVAMQSDRFGWRTIERLAIESGVEPSEAHEILAEHPGEVVLGKSREGKLIARLSER